MVNRILGILGWFGTGLVVIAVLIRFAYPAKDQYGYYLALAGLACVILYTLGQWREIGAVFSTRQRRYGTLAGASLLVVLGILIAVNYLGARQNKRWDLTANQAFSLSDQTRQILQKLDAPLQVMVFARETEFQRYQDKLREYEYASKRVTTEYVDPDKKPALAKQHQIQQYGTILLSYKDRTERLTSDTEQEITNGVIKAVSGQQRKVYFTQGHGEHDPTAAERDGYTDVATALGRENYAVDKIVLVQEGSVPEDASVVIVAGPKVDFVGPEIDMVKKYLARGGKLLLELDPPEKPEGSPLAGLVALAREWGSTVGNDVVVDASDVGRLLGTDASVPVASSYPNHPITQRFNFFTAFPLARSVNPVSGGVEGRTAQSFVLTGDRSWAESDVKGLMTTGKVSLDEKGGDKAGPVSVATAVSAPATDAEPKPAGDAKPADAKPDEKSDAPKIETRVVVIGDSDYASNAASRIQGNRDLFMNIVGWLSQQESLIAIRAREPADRRITMTAAAQSNLAWLSLLIIPACIFGTGVYTWWRRR